MSDVSMSSSNTPSPFGITPFPLARLYIRVNTPHGLKLPDYAGSMLRGAFGHELRRVSCMTRQHSCDNCPLLASCPYSLIFETPASSASSNQGSRPYVIEPPTDGHRFVPAGGYFEFAMVLMGSALYQLPLIMLAWQRALAGGLGPNKTPCALGLVHIGNPDMPILRPGGTLQDVPTHLNDRPAFWKDRRQVVLNVETPLRLQQQGRILGARDLDARTLLVSMARRYKQLAGDKQTVDFHALGEAASQLELQPRLVWNDWERYSTRQKQSMKMGGLKGEIMLTGDLQPFATLLEMGQRLHVGKEATFGLGGYQLQEHWSTAHWQSPESAA